MNYKSTNDEILVSFDEIREVNRNGQPGIYIVKPRCILAELEKKFGILLDLNFNFPSSQIGSITLLEGAMMVGLAKLVNAETIFEFGTFLGYSSRLFLKNFESANVVSMDLELSEDEKVEYGVLSKADAMEDDVDNDNFLKAMQQSRGAIYLDDLSERELDRLTLLKGNSLSLSPPAHGLESSVDFVFIDGGHQQEVIHSDTKNARKMQSPESVIAWHDFNSNIHGDVTEYLVGYSSSEVVFHIQSTMIAFSLKA